MLYVVLTSGTCGTHRASLEGGALRRRLEPARPPLTVLAVATVATALVSEVLVDSLTAFGERLGLSQFFVAAVIVALVGNAAEHGGAIVIAQRGNSALAAEIAVSSSTQVAVFVAPVIALLSGLVGRGLPLSFRPVELATMGGAALVVAFVDPRRAREALGGRMLDRSATRSSSSRSGSPATGEPGLDQGVGSCARVKT